MNRFLNQWVMKTIVSRKTARESSVASTSGALQPARVNKLCIFVGTTVGGYAGWALGEALGFDFFGAFLLSGAGSVIGVYAGWKLARKLE